MEHKYYRLGDLVFCVKSPFRILDNSVFECEVSEAQLCILKDILNNIIKASTDSIRIYHLSSNMKNNTIVLGQETAFDVNGPLVI